MSDPIDFHEAARLVAQSARAKVLDALDGIELDEAERRFVYEAAWDGGAPALVSLIGKVRESERDVPAEPDQPAGPAVEFAPVTDESKQLVLGAITRESRRAARSGWPGVPIGWLPLRDAPSLHALVDGGRVELITITKRGKAHPDRLMRYTYARLARDADNTQT
ncbi:hypothetical protein [Planotetraspora sp. GP83]|uniref:hypothetical protein n=1 Tax=Planotetraspora sp. GP83 TaxID=3156264 RepID=UPI003512789E